MILFCWVQLELLGSQGSLLFWPQLSLPVSMPHTSFTMALHGHHPRLGPGDTIHSPGSWHLLSLSSSFLSLAPISHPPPSTRVLPDPRQFTFKAVRPWHLCWNQQENSQHLEHNGIFSDQNWVSNTCLCTDMDICLCVLCRFLKIFLLL